MIIIPHENGGLVAGLNWEPVSKKKPARKHLLNTLRVTFLSAKRKRSKDNQSVPITGTCPWQKGRLWSLAALAVTWTGQNGYGVVQLADDSFVFLATQDGQPALGGDICGSLSDMQSVTDAFLAMAPMPADGWHVAATPLSPARPADILPARRKDWPARYRLTCPARTQRLMIFVAPALLCAGIATLWGVQNWREWSEQQARLAQEKLASMVPAGEAEPEVRYLPHPWADQPGADALLTICEKTLEALPLHPGNWQLTAAECRADGVMASWHRPESPLVTVSSLLEAVSANENITPFIGDDGDTAQTAHPLLTEMPAGENETLPEVEAQRLQLLSFFQSRGLIPALTAVPPEPVPQEEGVVWKQDWHALSFSHETHLPPSIQLSGLPLRGIRVTRIALTIGDTGLTWSYDATAYGRDPDIQTPEEGFNQ